MGHSKQFRRTIDRFGVILVMAPLAIALSALTHTGHRLPDLLAQFTAPTLIVTLAATLLVGLCGLARSAIAGAVTTGLLVLAVWPQWFPAQARPAEDGTAITVYSANLWARNTDIQAIAASIRAADPDIVMLAEVGNSAGAAIDLILPNHPYRTRSEAGNITVAPARVLIASRWPLERIPENLDDHLSAVAANAETPIGTIGLISAHLTRPWPFYPQYGQIRQARDLANLRAGLGDSVIVTGDFNSVSSARIGRQIQSETRLRPASALLGTWPAKAPAIMGITIDQVWHSNDLAVLERSLGTANGSDHRPVITRLTRAQAPSQ